MKHEQLIVVAVWIMHQHRILKQLVNWQRCQTLQPALNQLPLRNRQLLGKMSATMRIVLVNFNMMISDFTSSRIFNMRNDRCLDLDRSKDPSWCEIVMAA